MGRTPSDRLFSSEIAVERIGVKSIFLTAFSPDVTILFGLHENFLNQSV